MEPQHPPCPRCYSQEGVIRPWWGFKVIRNFWVAGMAVGILVMPLVAMDIVISMPLLMVYGLAAGPVFGLASQQPVCRHCGLGRPSPGWHETPVRPVRDEESRQWAPRHHVAAAVEPGPSADDEVSGVRSLPAKPCATDEQEQS